MQETWVQSLGWEDPQEKGKAIHSSILAWRIPWTTVLGTAKSQTQLSDWSERNWTELNNEWSEKVGLKLNIQKTKIMASGPITSWQIDGETVADFMFLGSKITADGDCSHEIKRHLLLGRKFMTNLNSIFKSKRHYFAKKGPSTQGYGFSSIHVWMWELDCEEG